MVRDYRHIKALRDKNPNWKPLQEQYRRERGVRPMAECVKKARARSEKLLPEIEARLAAGESHSEIARALGLPSRNVSLGLIHRARKRINN